MSRHHFFAATMLMIVWALPGCTFRDATPTILHLERPAADEEARVTFGMEEIGWEVQGEAETPLIVARGWHPRAHESYGYLFDEPYQEYQPRWLRATPQSDGRTWQLDLGIAPVLWPDTLRRPPRELGRDLIWLRGETQLAPLRDAKRIHFHLESVPMHAVDDPEEQVLLSGTVQADRLEPEAFDALRERLLRRLPQEDDAALGTASKP